MGTTDDPLKQAEVQRLTKDLLAYKDKEKAEAKDKTAKPKTLGTPALPSPKYTVEPAGDGCSLLLSVEVPGLTSMQNVSLDVADKSASIVFPGSANLGTLKTTLPDAVIPTKVKAKFSKKTQQIVVTMPLAGVA